MDSDFGQLVDFLHGELDARAAAVVRTRLETDAEFFGAIERLKRTYAVLRSLPSLPAGVTGYEPAGGFAAALRRQFESREWAALLPLIDGRPEFLRQLRTGFLVRALAGSIPPLEPGRDFVVAMRREFALRSVTRILPQLDPRPEFVLALRHEFAPRTVAASLPEIAVRDAFKRRLCVAMFEAAEAATEEAAVSAPLLPELQPRDPFRRRLFKRVLFASRRHVRERARRADTREYQWSRELGRGLSRSRHSLAYTLGVHALAIVLMLFIVGKPLMLEHQAHILRGATEEIAAPLLQGGAASSGWAGEEVEAEPLIGGGQPAMPDAGEIGLGGEVPPPEPEFERQELTMPEPRRTDASATAFEGQAPLDVAGYFRLRTASRSSKTAYLGSEALHRALDVALQYLEQTQHPNGAWGPVDVAHVTTDSDLFRLQQIEITSAALLAFLGDGHSSTRSPVGYDRNVRRALNWLVAQQQESGLIGPLRLANTQAHAMATLALAEAFALARTPELREPLRQACVWLCAADVNGAFPFKLEDDASLTTGVWAYMALSTAQKAGVPPAMTLHQRREAFLGWFEDMTSFRRTGPLVDHRELLAGTLLPVSASASLSMFATETELTTRSRAYLDEISRRRPDIADAGSERADQRYLFFGSLAMALDQRRGGTAHGPWQAALEETLLRNQQPDGSFTPASSYDGLYGRVYATAMAALSIENAWRINPQ